MFSCRYNASIHLSTDHAFLPRNSRCRNGDSVTHWLDGIKAGRDDEIQQLWDRYFQRLVRLAGTRLPGHARRAIDEEDVALSAFQSFCDRARKGQFPELANRDDLWRVLFAITVRKAVGAVRHQTRKKRGGGQVLGESALGGDERTQDAGLARFLSREPTPDDAAEFADQLDTLFEQAERRDPARHRLPEAARADIGGDRRVARNLHAGRWTASSS